jgi:putative FmdB family regulatory protein
MPLYEYVCDKCETKFEELRQSTRMDDPADCPAGHSGAHRVLSVFSAVTADPYGDPTPVSGGACGGGCTNCACGTN